MSLRSAPVANEEVEELPLTLNNEFDDKSAITTTRKPVSKLRMKLLSAIDFIENQIENSHTIPAKLKRVIHEFKHTNNLLYGTLGLFTFIFLIKHLFHTELNSYRESFGLLEVSNQDWDRIKRMNKRTEKHKFDKLSYIDDPHVWYQYNYPRNFVCPNEQKIGKIITGTDINKHQIQDYDGYLGDGKWLCNPKGIVNTVKERMKRTSFQKFLQVLGHKYPSKNSCLIYSIGVNGNGLHFEKGIQKLLSHAAGNCNQKGGCKPFCEIHIFDPGRYHEQMLFEEGIIYHDFGIVSSVSLARTDAENMENPGETEMRQHFKSFQETIIELGHVGHVIDVMKVDCKMCEWGIYDDWFDREYPESSKHHRRHRKAGVTSINQLLVEVHGTPEEYVNDFFERIEEENYAIFHKDSDTQNFQGTSQDYAFLKLDKSFFK